MRHYAGQTLHHARCAAILNGRRRDQGIDADRLAAIVLPEFGRDSSLNQRNGLDHGDNSTDLRKVAMIAAGPDFKVGKTISKDMKSIDVTPTACALMGVKAEHAKGRVMRELLVR